MLNPAKSSRRLFRSLLAAVSLVALSSTVACVSSSDSTEADQAAAVEKQQAHHHHSPVQTVVEAALSSGELSEAQATAIAEIGADNKLSRADYEELREQLRASAASVVRAGHSDSDEFDGALEQVTEAMQDRMGETGEALKEIHTLLEPTQREAVADALAQRLEERWGNRGGAKRGDGVKRVASHLMLSALQLDKLKAIGEQLRAHSGAKKNGREQIAELIEAFRTDEFAAKLDAYQDLKLERARDHMARAADTTDTVLSVFNAEQRGLLAELIEEGPSKMFLGEK